MMPSLRRSAIALFTLGLGSLAFDCSVLHAESPGRLTGSPVDAFSATLERLRAAALLQGLAAPVFEAATAGVVPDPAVVERMSVQAEHEETPAAYVTRRLSDERIAAGRQRLALHAKDLEAIRRRFGLDPSILVSIWGLESNYGSHTGDYGVLRSLATLAHSDGRRTAFWTNEFVSALSVLAENKVAAGNLSGSWAGAMGHMQLMPSTLLTYGVDFDGDGRRDVIGSPVDALASAAAYLQSSGWQSELAWGAEVVLPRGERAGEDAASGVRRLLPAWQAIGVAVADEALPASRLTGPLRLVLPHGLGGPAFLVTANFDSILQYNNSTSYALAVGLLADRISGRPPLRRSWPLDERALTRIERLEMQQLLSAIGHDTGGLDGILGTRSREAVRRYQTTQSLPADGYPSLDVLELLRRHTMQQSVDGSLAGGDER